MLWRRREGGPRVLVELNGGSGNRWTQSADKPAAPALSLSLSSHPAVRRPRRRGQLSVLPPADSGRRTNELTGPRPERSSRVLESLLDGCRAGRGGSRCGAGRPVSETPRERERQAAYDGGGWIAAPARRPFWPRKKPIPTTTDNCGFGVGPKPKLVGGTSSTGQHEHRCIDSN